MSTPSLSHGAYVASAVERHVVGGERDVTIGQELAEDLGYHAAGLCKLEDEVHVALFFFSSVQDLLCFDFANRSPTNFLIFSLKKNLFLIFRPYCKFLGINKHHANL